MTYGARTPRKVECEIGYNSKNSRSSFAHAVEHDGSYCGRSPFLAEAEAQPQRDVGGLHGLRYWCGFSESVCR